MPVNLPPLTSSTTCAPGGTGKLPTGALNVTMPPESEHPGVVCAAALADEDEDEADEDEVWPPAGEAGPAVEIAALHAASDRPAAQAAAAMTVERNAFMRFPSRRFSLVLRQT